MSILISEAYANTGSKFWRPFQTSTPAIVSVPFAGGVPIGTAGSYFAVSGLTIGQRYTFTLSGGVTCASALSSLNDGTNSIALQCSTINVPSASKLPLEIAPNSNVSTYISTNFPGLLSVLPTWTAVFNGSSDSNTLTVNTQITLTTNTNTLYFMLANVNNAPSIANGVKTILPMVITYSQPIT